MESSNNPAITTGTIWIGIGILFFIITIPQGFYIYHLSEYGWSSDPAKWGQYGDFIGGITNPLLAVVNIIILVWLTNTVQNIEHERTIRLAIEDSEKRAMSLALEKKRQDEITKLEEQRNQAVINTQKLVAMSHFRIEAFDKLMAELKKTYDLKYLHEREKAHMDLHKYLITFNAYYGYLFDTPDFKEKIARTTQVTLEVSVRCERYRQIAPAMDILKMQEDKRPYEDLNQKIVEYQKTRNKLISIIQHIIIDKPYIESTT